MQTFVHSTVQMLNFELIIVKARSQGSVIAQIMGRILHSGLRLVLVLSLMVAGAARALPMSQMQGYEAIVICSDGGSSTIYLDQTGKPVQPMKNCGNCPHCLNLVALHLAPSPNVNAFVASWQALIVRVTGEASLFQRYLIPESRGPPPVTHGTYDLARVAAHDSATLKWFSGACQPDGRSNMVART